MSQEAVERILGRMLTDGRFRAEIGKSPESASRRAGYVLTPCELRLLSALELQRFDELGGWLNPGLRRAGAFSEKNITLRITE